MKIQYQFRVEIDSVLLVSSVRTDDMIKIKIMIKKNGTFSILFKINE